MIEIFSCYKESRLNFADAGLQPALAEFFFKASCCFSGKSYRFSAKVEKRRLQTGGSRVVPRFFTAKICFGGGYRQLHRQFLVEKEAGNRLHEASLFSATGAVFHRKAACFHRGAFARFHLVEAPLSGEKTDETNMQAGQGEVPSPFFQRAGLTFHAVKKGWIILSGGLDYSFMLLLSGCISEI